MVAEKTAKTVGGYFILLWLSSSGR